MATYFNPGNESFRKDIRSKIYVDKTGLLEILNEMLFTNTNCIALSHARRFGKSQAAGMIDAYYSFGSDSHELFAPYNISRSTEFEKHLNQYNVIHLDISSFADFHTDDLLETLTEAICSEMRSVFPAINYDATISNVLSQVYEQSGRAFIIILDEWDCVIRNQSNRQDLVHRYLQFLHALFKSEESRRYLALAYITGILPIKKIKDESALNNFREYTMLNSRNMTPFFGFTEQEVRQLCQQYGMDFETIRNWYDGYVINGQHMYNPYSVCQSMLDGSVDSYWKNTSAFSTINDLITLNYEGLKDDILTMMAGGRVSVNPNKFQNDLSVINSKDDALTALIHLGYLAYDAERSRAYIPNYEVSVAFQLALETGKWTEIANTLSQCDDLLWATIDGDSEKVATIIEQAHETYTSVLKYNDENSLACVLTMAYFTAPAYYNVIREMPAGKGFADLVFIPRAGHADKPAIIVELKCDEPADTAIRQIKEKRYDGALNGYNNIILVGIDYDKNSKKHSCIIRNNKHYGTK